LSGAADQVLPRATAMLRAAQKDLT
jgi:hypothetical protein